MKTYDVHFNNNTDSNNKGFKETKQYCKQYIRDYNGTDYSYFKDYKGGVVSIVCNETGETVYEEEVKIKFTKTQKKQVAKLVAEKAAALENETIHVWISSGDFRLTTGSQEYRDDDHELVTSIDIRNEGHPYTQIGIMRILEFQGI